MAFKLLPYKLKSPAAPKKTSLRIVPKKDEGWKSAGVRKKPAGCEMCAFSQIGTGFCPDWVPSAAKVAFLFSAPRSGDVTNQEPLSSEFGRVVRSVLVEDQGYSWTDVAVFHVIRCQPPLVKGELVYPTAFLRESAEAVCRQYDDSRAVEGRFFPEGIISWQPTMFIPTLGMEHFFDVDAFRRLITLDVEKAWRFSTKGERPVVLFGREPMDLAAKFLHGPVKNWRGHFFKGSWPFEAKVYKPKQTFAEVKR